MFREGFPISALSIGHILWLDLAAISIPALGIASSPAIGDPMKRQPYRKNRIFERGLRKAIILRGLLTGSLVLAAFAFVLGGRDSWEANRLRAMTVSLTALFVSQIGLAFECCRAPGENLFRRFSVNKILLGAIAKQQLTAQIIVAKVFYHHS
jgi:magnesium-transporting ATPase (P-type)